MIAKIPYVDNSSSLQSQEIFPSTSLPDHSRPTSTVPITVRPAGRAMILALLIERSRLSVDASKLLISTSHQRLETDQKLIKARDSP